jgi:hypothetical protein
MESKLTELNTIQRVGIIAGIIASIIAVAAAVILAPAPFFHAYLFTYLFFLGITLGSLALAMLHYLVGGSWGIVILRTVESASKSLWLLAILFIPIVFGLRYLYPWADPEIVAGNPVLQHNHLYLNPVFFAIRAVVYFAVWLFLAYRLISWSQQEVSRADLAFWRRFQRFSALGLAAYALTMSFAGMDWLMSLQPDWYSSIYGMLVIISQVLVALAFSIALTPILSKYKPLSDFITPSLYRDMGAMLLALVMAWAYLAFSQLLIIWSGDLPREVSWYLARTQGGWIWVGILIFLFQFAIPFSFLISLRAKRDARIMAGLSISITAISLVNLYWEVKPVFSPGQFSIHLLDFLMPIAIGGFWLAVFIYNLKRTPPLIVPEQKIQEILEHERRQSHA